MTRTPPQTGSHPGCGAYLGFLEEMLFPLSSGLVRLAGALGSGSLAFSFSLEAGFLAGSTFLVLAASSAAFAPFPADLPDLGASSLASGLASPLALASGLGEAPLGVVELAQFFLASGADPFACASGVLGG